MRPMLTLMFIFLPSMALAAPATNQDFEDLYELVEEMGGGLNSCSATGQNGSNCMVSCPAGDIADCYGDQETEAYCNCIPKAIGPADPPMSKRSR
jgi:hypothetical protein